MAETPSQMIPLGTTAPRFSLLDTMTGQLTTLERQPAPLATVVMFLSNHCPYVKHIRSKLIEVVHTYQAKNIAFIGIGSNDATAYPEDGPDRMKQVAAEFAYPFPYLHDETQAVAKAYHATCTPDFFIFDQAYHCVYRGCFDESTPGNQQPLTGAHLIAALDAISAGERVNPIQKPSLGCNIKWKKA